ncbi:hypothetical protein T07_667 [Trichinella nelsoni]|uniref:Uncharacterized protein n=1 Tax=Trichinella nelsoni TaxID=6336 RepID=A0A0V0S7H8_9BILA|nr:hypothetical protein T07_667 [Trichinella nelsoni]
MKTDGSLSNTSDAEEEEVHSEKELNMVPMHRNNFTLFSICNMLATPLSPHYFVKTEGNFNLFIISLLTFLIHRYITDNAAILLPYYESLTISLDVSIAVYHVPSSAPLSGLPHRQSKNEFDAREEYLRGLDTQYNVLQWLVEPADMTELFWSSFRSRYRGMSDSSIFLNLLLIVVRYVDCTDFVHDSNGFPHIFKLRHFLLALCVEIVAVAFPSVPSVPNYVKSTSTSIACVHIHPSNVQVRVAMIAFPLHNSTGLRRPIMRVRSTLHLDIKACFPRCPNVPLLTRENVKSPVTCRLSSLIVQLDQHVAFWYRTEAYPEATPGAKFLKN